MQLHLLIPPPSHSFHKHLLLAHYVAGIFQGSGDTAISKKENYLCTLSAYTLKGREENI